MIKKIINTLLYYDLSWAIPVLGVVFALGYYLGTKRFICFY